MPDPDPDPTPDPEPDPEPPPELDELRPGVAGPVLTHGEAFFSGGGQWWVKLNIVTLDAYNVAIRSLRWGSAKSPDRGALRSSLDIPMSTHIARWCASTSWPTAALRS